MKLGYTIIYVNNVEESLAFYQKAFNLKILFLDESKAYGELDTGTTKLAFASQEAIEMSGNTASLHNSESKRTFEIAFLSENVEKDVTNACNNGATLIVAPAVKPWGQTVAYVKDINGVLVEICSVIQ
ncbi:VOC family protein [Rickettsiales bacterium LUAb2]